MLAGIEMRRRMTLSIDRRTWMFKTSPDESDLSGDRIIALDDDSDANNDLEVQKEKKSKSVQATELKKKRKTEKPDDDLEGVVKELKQTAKENRESSKKNRKKKRRTAD